MHAGRDDRCFVRYDNAYRYILHLRLGQLKEIVPRINVGRPPGASTLHQRRGIRGRYASPFRRFVFRPANGDRVLSV